MSMTDWRSNVTGADLAWMVSAIAVAVVLITLISCWHGQQVAYIEAGYTHVSLPGQAAVQWVKP